jgi:hypothetical protein
MSIRRSLVPVVLTLGLAVACDRSTTPSTQAAQAFLADANATLLRLGVEQQQARR